jgi:hypothetical protein
MFGVCVWFPNGRNVRWLEFLYFICLPFQSNWKSRESPVWCLKSVHFWKLASHWPAIPDRMENLIFPLSLCPDDHQFGSIPHFDTQVIFSLICPIHSHTNSPLYPHVRLFSNVWFFKSAIETQKEHMLWVIYPTQNSYCSFPKKNYPQLSWFHHVFIMFHPPCFMVFTSHNHSFQGFQGTSNSINASSHLPVRCFKAPGAPRKAGTSEDETGRWWSYQ